MKKLFKRYRHTLALAAVCLLAFAVFQIGLSLGAPVASCAASAVCIVGCWQVAQLAMSQRRAACFFSGLTPEQITEFDGILKDFKREFELHKEDRAKFAEMRRDLDALRRQGLSGGSREVVPPGSVVSDNCARHLVGQYIVAGQKQGKFDLLESGKREVIMNLARSMMGDLQFKTALSSSDIPLPVEYSGQVVSLVGMYGTARSYGTVFPSGSGQLKLPRLKTDPAFGLLTQSTAITEKSPQTEWVTFNAEKFGGLIRLPSEMDEDSIVPLGNFIAEYAARQIAICEDTQFWVSTGAGSGVNGSVEGLTKSTITNSKTTVSGVLGSPSEFTLAHFRTLRTVCAASALRRGAYYLHPTFEPMLASFNTGGNKPYNPTSQIKGSGSQPFEIVPTLDGFPIRWIDVMPVHSTADVLSTVHVLFGDAKFQYLTPRGPIRFQSSVDAAFETDEVLIRALERFTIGLMATSAVGGLITHSA